MDQRGVCHSNHHLPLVVVVFRVQCCFVPSPTLRSDALHRCQWQGSFTAYHSQDRPAHCTLLKHRSNPCSTSQSFITSTSVHLREQPPLHSPGALSFPAFGRPHEHCWLWPTRLDSFFSFLAAQNALTTHPAQYSFVHLKWNRSVVLSISLPTQNAHADTDWAMGIILLFVLVGGEGSQICN